MIFPPIYKGSLIPETAATVIERAVARFLCVAYQLRLRQSNTQAATPDIPTLRLFRRNNIADYALRFVESIGKTYRFDQFEDGLDDGALVVRPADSQSGSLGAWVQEGASPAQRTNRHQGVRDAALRLDKYALRRTGFTKLTRIYEGDYDDEAIAEIFALKPAYVILPYRTTHEPKSLVPGAYYKEFFKFRVWGISQSLRRGPAGILGSGVQAEAIVDPGLNYIMGAARRALAGSTLGLLGVISTEIGDEDIVAHDLANRVFCNAMDISVAATLHLPDDDIVPLTAVTVTHQLPDKGEEPAVDLANYVAEGCNPPRASSSLMQQIAGGLAYITGKLVRAIPQSVNFPASSETYRDLLPGGGFVVQSVALGSLPPDVPAGALRIGVTTTDASGIVSDRFICSTLFDFVGPDRIPKEP